ncbi:MFS transporter [Acinetobacter qingfengensis]|uniref:MFS transporter n=1 Tax=Acinetobacter qingfengensis TaxID=1262585 RepID=A0A1E7QWR1_9GAMM|nr:MFS transporter [Acinetobacter qingfengensis]KAA8731254.1 MFS transporter [Acinetobacter qingfengensis]OEY91527.1 MFS transporter [Acinetobacter qingfengensis]
MSSNTILTHINQQPMTMYQWFVIGICICLNIIDGFDVMVMAFTAPSVSAEWHLSASHVGILLSAGLFGMAGGSIFLAPFADKIGRRKLILTCLAIAAASMLASAEATSHTMLAIFRFVTGLGVGGILASSNVVASEYANVRWRSLAVSLMSTGYGIGATLGGVLSLTLIGEFGWRSVFLAGGITTVVMLVLAIWLLPESLDYLFAKRPKNALLITNKILQKMKIQTIAQLPDAAVLTVQQEQTAISKLFHGNKARQTLLLWFSFFLVMFGFYFVMSWTPKILIAMGMSAKQGVSAGILISIGGIFGAAIIGLLAAKIRIFYALSSFLGLTALCVFLFVSVSAQVSTAFIVGVFLGLLINGCVAGLYSISPTIYAADVRNRGVGYAIGFGRLGAILSPIVAGVFLDQHIAAATIYAYYGVVFIFAIVLILLLSREVKREQQQIA